MSQLNVVAGVKKFTSMSSGSDVKLSLINAVDLSKVIPLHISQDIPANLNIIAAAVRHNLFVGGLVNGRILQSEFDNTLLVSNPYILVIPCLFWFLHYVIHIDLSLDYRKSDCHRY